MKQALTILILLLLSAYSINAYVAAYNPNLTCQKPGGDTKIINPKSTSLRVKAYRVIDRREGNYSRWIVIEYIDRAKFQVVAYFFFGGPLPSGMKTRIEQDDMWNALNALKNGVRLSESNQTLLSVGDSIDFAIAQDKARQQELLERARLGKTPAWGTSEQESSDQRTKPMIIARPGGGSSEENLQRMTQDVWDYAGGKQLKWKPVGRTPAGYKCEVLTFNGSEEALIGGSSVEIKSLSM